MRELGRQFERLELLTSQIKALERERAAVIAHQAKIPNGRKIAAITQLRGVGEGGATTLVTEVFHRQFRNRRHLASYLGLAPSHFASGEVSRDQGISKAGNKPARYDGGAGLVLVALSATKPSRAMVSPPLRREGRTIPQSRCYRTCQETRDCAVAFSGAGLGA
ncbi:MAG: transposase [Hyphomonadaceae bacterium]|nr:transposase [Hyphomonadaceae bacterium]